MLDLAVDLGIAGLEDADQGRGVELAGLGVDLAEAAAPVEGFEEAGALAVGAGELDQLADHHRPGEEREKGEEPRISLATGPAWEKKSKRPRPSPGAACIHNSIVIIPSCGPRARADWHGKPKRRSRRAFLSSKTPATGLRLPASKERAG